MLKKISEEFFSLSKFTFVFFLGEVPLERDLCRFISPLVVWIIESLLNNDFSLW